MRETEAQARDVQRRLATLAALVVALLVLGTLGYCLSEGVDPWRGFTWTLDNLATIGSIPEPHDTAGQIVRVVLTLLGVGTLFYALVSITELVVTGELSSVLAHRRERRMTDRLSDHFIICGFGGVGVRFILAKPSEDDALREAGIARARAVVACVDSDAENIFIALTARELRPDIAIVARAALEESESKLRRAGADRIVSPYKASGAEMARLALHPNVTGAMEVAAEYRLEEIAVTEGSDGLGRRVGDVRGGSFIVAIRRADGTFEPQPPTEAVLREGDVVMAIGTPRTLARLEGLFESERPAAEWAG
jgi:voltage-gated potassium channel